MRERPPPPFDPDMADKETFEQYKNRKPERFKKFDREKSLKKADELRNLSEYEIIYGRKPFRIADDRCEVDDADVEG